MWMYVIQSTQDDLHRKGWDEHINESPGSIETRDFPDKSSSYLNWRINLDIVYY